MANDGLSSVYQGREGTGEAIILDSNNATGIANIFYNDQLKKKKEAEVQADKMASVMDDPVSKWTSSNFRYLEPKIQELKSEFPDYMRKVQSEKDPLKKTIMTKEWENKWAALRKEALLDSQTFDWWAKEIANVRSNPGKYESEVDLGNGRILSADEAEKEFSDPLGSGLQDEVQKAGGLAQWRLLNAPKYKPQLSYSASEDLDKYAKTIKLDEIPDKNLTSVDGKQVLMTTKKLDPQRAEELYRVFHDRTDLKGTRWRQRLEKAASEFVTIVKDSKGKEFFAANTNAPIEVVDAVEELNKQPGTIAQKASKLAYEIGKTEFKARFPEQRNAKFAPTSNSFSFNSGNGLGDEFSVGDIQDTDNIIGFSKQLRDGKQQSFKANVRGESFVTTPVKVTLQTPSLFFDSETGQRITESKVHNISVGMFKVAPLATKDLILEDGTRIFKGSIIDDPVLKKPDLLAKIKAVDGYDYKVIAFAGKDRGKGDGDVYESSYYTPLVNVEGRIMQGLKKEQSQIMESRLQKLKDIAMQKTSKIKNRSMADKLKEDKEKNK